jgi:serine/threonine protein kinase
MTRFESKDIEKDSSGSKRHFTVVMDGKEHGLYISSRPYSAAKKVVTKLCSANKSKKVKFYIREITQGSKKKTYGLYIGYMDKLKEPIKLKGRTIMHKPVVKLSRENISKKRVIKGGGFTYKASLFVDEKVDIKQLIETARYDNDNTVVFTIKNITTNEIIKYENIRCLGQGTYGKVFLVSNNGKNYVIKITNDNQEFFLEEPKILNSFMNKIDSRCQYKAISQGISIIQGVYIGHIIFPFKGKNNLVKVIIDKKFNLIPNILRDVISCLIRINNFACQGDLRLENIVYDDATKNSFIIDYGLSFLFPIDIDKLKDITIGNRQISVEIILAYLLKINSNNINNSNINNLYSQYIDSIQTTIDNFGLFWIIVESICGDNIFKNFFKDASYLIKETDKKEFNNYLNFYFNLDNNGNPTELMEKIKKLFNYLPYPNFRKEFIEYIRRKVSPEKFGFYFNNNEILYKNFMEKVLQLVRIDPTTRISKEILLQDPFFNKPLLPNVPINLQENILKLPNVSNYLQQDSLRLPNVPNYLLDNQV